MKHNARRLLALLMALALMCGMLPAAMAASYYDDDDIRWSDYCDDGSKYHDYEIDDRDTDESYEYFYCNDCNEYGRREHDWDDYKWVDNSEHSMYCNNRECYYYDVKCYEEHDFDSDDYCYYCEDGYYYDVDLEIETADDLGSGDVYEYDDEVELEVWVEVWDGNDDITDDCWIEFDWEGDLDEGDNYYDEDAEDDDDAYSNAYMDTSGSYAEVTCYITVYDDNWDKIAEDEVSWDAEEGDYGGDDDIVVEATVYNTSDGYYLDDKDDEGGTSIEDQIADAVADIDDYYELEYVRFSDVSASGKGALNAKTNRDYYYYDCYEKDPDYLLEEVVFTPEEDFDGEVEFEFTAYYYDDYDEDYDDESDLKRLYGVIVFNVESGASGVDIVYVAEKGDNVPVDEDDLVDFWAGEYPNGELEYVQFTSVSSGNLYDYYDGGSAKRTDVKGTKCYLDPTGKQLSLDDLTYVPARTTSSATIGFTARGTTGSGSKTANLSGKINILYIAEQGDPIKYDSAGQAVTLDADDFIAYYKEVMGVSTVGNLQIQFTKVPAYGTLYMQSTLSTSGQVSGTALKSTTVGNYKFSTSTTAAYAIDKLTYLPTGAAADDAIEFYCYSGSQLKCVGSVVFTTVEPVSLRMTGAMTGVNFSAGDFFTGSGSMSSASYITFGVPSTGVLYANYANGTGTRVNSLYRFAASGNSSAGVSAISNVTYVPSRAGVATIPFTAYTYTGAQIPGTLTIEVVANQFSDVKETDWYYPYLMPLVADGIFAGIPVYAADGSITGYGFYPQTTLSYGQALKLIMMAAGYPEQAPTGTHWASGYLSKALSAGLVSNADVNLDAGIDRDTIAAIAARSLRMIPASSLNPGVAVPSDSTNGYVYALYNAGIVGGVNESDGKNYYYGGSFITRAEISKIVYLMDQYYEKNN